MDNEYGYNTIMREKTEKPREHFPWVSNIA
jgi:hypothetical protein